MIKVALAKVNGMERLVGMVNCSPTVKGRTNTDS